MADRAARQGLQGDRAPRLQQGAKDGKHLAIGQDGWNVVLSGLETYLETGWALELPMAG